LIKVESIIIPRSMQRTFIETPEKIKNQK